MANPHDQCTTCGGLFKEHEGRIHPFTLGAAELSTPKQREDAQRKAQGAPMRVALPGIQGTDSAAIGRLMEVLIDHQLITTDEALYVFGVGSKPPQPSGYQDPFPSSKGGQ